MAKFRIMVNPIKKTIYQIEIASGVWALGLATYTFTVGPDSVSETTEA